MKKFLIILALQIFLLVPFCLYGCKGCSDEQPVCQIEFFIDGESFYVYSQKENDKIMPPDIQQREGFVFKGWYKTEEYLEKWNFSVDSVKADTALYGYWVSNSEETFNILFYCDGTLSNYVKVHKNEIPPPIQNPIREGYSFSGWYSGDKLYDFNQRVTDDVILTDKWNLIDYTVKFIADGKTIKQVTYNVVNPSIIVPQVPDKHFYSGKWQDFSLTTGDIEVNAIYTPLTYTAKYVIDGDIISEIKYTVEDEITAPKLPQKTGYSASWSASPEGGDITITAVYTPIVYKINYVANNTTVKSVEYTVENYNITPPAVPERKGYTGIWEEKIITIGDVTINALYTILIYTASFVSNGKTISVQYFDVENLTVTPPKLENDKIGYIKAWEEFALSASDITISTIYIPITYKIDFYADETLITSEQFTLEDTEVEIPKIPSKTGYSSEWEEFTLKPENIRVNAIFTPLTYYVTFIDENNNTVAKLPFTIENMQIDEPPPPSKTGFIVKWNSYKIILDNITVTANYEPVPQDNFNYTELADGTLKITGYAGTNKSVVVPSEINEKPVRVIGEAAFLGSKIESIKFGYGLEIIEKEAFYETRNLQVIELPTSLKSIKERAFAYSSIPEIILPNSLTELCEQTFSCSLLETIKLSDNLHTLQSVFYICDELKNVDLGQGLKVINKEAFFKCPSLENIAIPASVELIKPEAFVECPALERAVFENKNWLIYSNFPEDGHPIKADSLSDEYTAASYLIKILYGVYWKKADN